MSPTELLDLKMSEPEDRDAVVVFQVAFPESPNVYTYAAIKARRQWYSTGRDGAQGRTWEALINLLCRDKATITKAKLATTLEDLL